MASMTECKYQWQRAVLSARRLHFDRAEGLQQALRDGFLCGARTGIRPGTG